MTYDDSLSCWPLPNAPIHTKEEKGTVKEKTWHLSNRVADTSFPLLVNVSRSPAWHRQTKWLTKSPPYPR